MKSAVGRPKGINAYGDATKPIRIPTSKIDDVFAFLEEHIVSKSEGHWQRSKRGKSRMLSIGADKGYYS